MIASLFVAGCASSDRGEAASRGLGEGSAGGGSSAASPGPSDAIAAIVDGQAVPYASLRPLMTEAAGGQALAELILDRKIDGALAEAGLSVTDADMAAEKRLMMRQLSADADVAARLLDQLRDNRGLGEQRFRLLLRRNAAMRKLVADEVQVTEPMVREAYLLSHGERFSARMILTPTLVDANRALRRVRDGEPFTDVAIEMSVDRSKNQGGLMPDISPWDPTMPAAIRQTVTKLEPGEVSDPMSIDGGFAVLKLERKIAGDGADWDAVRPGLHESVKLRVEAAAIQRRIRAMLEQASVTVLDASLDGAWKRQRDAALRAD